MLTREGGRSTSGLRVREVQAEAGTDPAIALVNPTDARPLPTGATYSGGPAAPSRTLWDILEATAAQFPTAAAVDDGSALLDYAALLREVHRLADELAAAGIGAGDRVGVRVSSGTAQLYVSILAVLAVGAAYVPVDRDDPDERADLVWSEAGACAVLGDAGELVQRRINLSPAATRRPTPDDDAWIIFTSGTTGKPKGVAVTHRNAAAFVDAEANLFVCDAPLGPGDRVLAGLSVAFDASCEEMWLAWRHGACLVPAPRALVRTGPELAGWLRERQISVVSTVPTMASLWPAEQLQGVRLLILGGEKCPSGLADRLAGQCSEVWNTYGPTEGTVVTCAHRLRAGEPVRIGLPLHGWQLAVVRPETGEPVPWGEVGELVIGGAGVARYLDAAQDAAKFAPLASLGWQRAYRSGDLVRADREGLVYVGRADSQVKIRGYRIELSEIESVLLKHPGIAQAAVTTHEPTPGLVELAAYYSLRDPLTAVDRQQVFDQLRRQLPAHMVPAYLEHLPVIPLLGSGKADRASLPAPTSGRRLALQRPHVAPATRTETVLARALAEVLDLEQVSADAHFFDELGLSSLLVAHFCARVRLLAPPSFPSVSTRDVYLHPTVPDLAATVEEAARTSDAPTRPTPPAPLVRASTAQVVLCGALQFLVFLASLVLTSAVGAAGISWISASNGWQELYLRSLAFGAGTLSALCTLPILAKWILIGRWKPQQIKIWSLGYVRFWLVKTLIRTNPLAMFAGSPLYVLYLRALGAKIGRRVVILSTTVPVCTDLLTIGDDTVIRRRSSFTGYRAQAGVIETGPITIGRNALVGEHTVLDLRTSLGDHAQLGHTSSLHESQHVPDGQRWHGSPAQPTQVDYRRVEPMPSGPLRRVGHGLLQVLTLVFVTTPLLLSLAGLVIASAQVTNLGSSGPKLLSTWGFYVQGLILSTVLFVGALLVGAVIVLTVPRILHRLITPGRTYPLYGLRHGIHRVIRRLTNTKFYLELTGDSSYVVGYLKALGYRMPDVEQTGSNFGASLSHETPFLVEVGRGTMVADGGSLLNADYSSTSFQVTPLSIGARSFLGNAIAYPAGGRVGDNCLIATKAMVPLDGPIRENVGLLGSPCFEIPRSVTYDPRFDHLKTGPEFQRRLAAKNRHNLGTMALFLLVRWIHVIAVTMLAMAIDTMYRWRDIAGAIVGLTVTLLAILLFTLAYFVIVERAVLRFRPLRPQYCSIYDPYFWSHERYWKLLTPHIAIFNGTPFKSVLWRLLGVRMGKRVFDDGCAMAERSLVTIGKDCTLNAGSLIQCHSMEDGTFKSNYTQLDAGATLCTGSYVHYDVTIGRRSTILPDSFVMKGEKVPAGSRWGGNPARPM